jgi:hypothetical protein
LRTKPEADRLKVVFLEDSTWKTSSTLFPPPIPTLLQSKGHPCGSKILKVSVQSLPALLEIHFRVLQ